MVQFPREIWLHVAQFIPGDQLYSLLDVNSVFYDLSMRLRYEIVQVNDVNESTRHRLTRLLDPGVAWRVRTLIFRPHHRFQSDLREKPNWRKRLQIFSSKKRKYSAAPASSLSLQEMINHLLHAIPGLTHVTEFRIDSWNIPTTVDLHLLLTAAWASFGSKLKKVSLAGNLESYQAFATSSPNLVALTDLSMEFTNNLFRNDEERDARILLGVVVPLVNRLAPHLQSLVLDSWATLDLSKFFMQLGPFPSLRSIVIRGAFNRALRTDPSGLTKVLCQNAATLQHVKLKLKPNGATFNPDSERALAQWLTENASSDSTMLTGLKSLSLYPTMLPEGIAALRQYIKRSRDTLLDLCTRDRYLRYSEVDTLIQEFGDDSPLEVLQINVLSLNGQLLDLLATKLPSLQILRLFIGRIGNDNSEHPTNENHNLDVIRNHYFGSWKLRDLGVWQGGSKIDTGAMHILAQSIPSVQSFWGEGKNLKYYISKPENAVQCYIPLCGST